MHISGIQVQTWQGSLPSIPVTLTAQSPGSMHRHQPLLSLYNNLYLIS